MEAAKINVPILSELLGEVPVGRSILVLHDPDSQSNMFLLNILSEYLQADENALFATSTRSPSDVRHDLQRLGFDLAKYEVKDTALLFDAYTIQMGKKSAEKYHAETLNLNELSVAIAQSAPSWPPRTLNIFDSLSAIAVGQEGVFGRFYRKYMITWKAYGAILISGITSGVHPSNLYEELKLISDGVVEIKLAEDQGEIVNTVRARSMKGQNVDTRTRRIVFDDRMKVSLKPISS